MRAPARCIGARRYGLLAALLLAIQRDRRLAAKRTPARPRATSLVVTGMLGTAGRAGVSSCRAPAAAV